MQKGRSPLEPGSRLDRYELLCPIAHGGMALVWLARMVGKHGFEKLVAIKTILPEYAADPRFQQMFLDEARIASGIEHVNVAHILDLGEQHDILYIVMEWVDGDSLSKLHRAVERRGERIPLGILLRIMADACGGLHAAHELTDKTGRALGVVHRDVSPQNILVSSKGNAKLIDFGIAKALVRLSGETNAGLLKGKIQYMAPEQAMGRPLDRRADVWAVGACLYYLLSGVPPFDGENQLATLHMLTGGNPPPPLPTSVPVPVRDLVFRALAFDPSQRTPSAADMQRQLEQAMLACGAYTMTNDVAAFVARELGDRAEARKHAIDVALNAAATRAQINTSIMSTTSSTSDSGSGTPIRSSPLASTYASAHSQPYPKSSDPSTMAATMLAPAPGSHPPVPAHTLPLGAEHPDHISQVSNATLGSAAVAYPQGSVPPPARPRRGSGAVIAVVCGLGAGLVLCFAWYAHLARRTVVATSPAVTQTVAPAIATEPAGQPNVGATTVATSTAAPPVTATSEPAIPSADDNAVASAKPTSSANSAITKPHAAKTGAASTKPSGAHTSTSTDYGF